MVDVVYDPPPGPVPVVYHDDWLIAVNKPAGLLSVPGRGPLHADSVTTRVGAREVHRLDMDTSGLMLLARDADTHRALSGLFQDRQIRKTYTALVAGRVAEDRGSVDFPLAPDWPNRPRQKVCETGKPAQTHWQVLERRASHTRVALTPITGRSHQLRVHMAALGHAIVGDRLYGGAPADRMMLHATRLEFAHPQTGAEMDLQSEAPF